MSMDDIGREPTPLANHVTQVRQVLSQHLPWSPHSFIRRLSFEGDREWYAQELTRELAGDTDLRFIFRNRAEQALAVFCEVLPWDSEFFGKTVARLSAVSPLEPPFYDRDLEYGEAVNHVLELCRERGVRYLFAQVDPRDLALLRALGDHGFRLIETRAHYHMPLEDFAPADRFAARLAVPADVPSLARTASEMVNDFDRFHADPAIPKELADKLMARWVEASIEGGFSDGAIVPAAPDPTAFCTVKLHKKHWERWHLKLSQPVFSAVGPAFRGWYRKIISELNCYMQSEGAEHAFLVTQVTNNAVIHCWESLGYRFGKAEHVFSKEFS